MHSLPFCLFVWRHTRSSCRQLSGQQSCSWAGRSPEWDHGHMVSNSQPPRCFVLAHVRGPLRSGPTLRGHCGFAKPTLGSGGPGFAVSVGFNSGHRWVPAVSLLSADCASPGDSVQTKIQVKVHHIWEPKHTCPELVLHTGHCHSAPCDQGTRDLGDANQGSIDRKVLPAIWTP